MQSDAPVRIGLLGVRIPVQPAVDPVLAASIVTNFLTEQLRQPWEPVQQILSAPSQTQVAEHLIHRVDREGCVLIFTLGGIGTTAADVVPDAISAACPKPFPGFGERIRQQARPVDPAALLLRPVAGIRGQTVVVGLPAEPATLRACLPALFPAIPNAVFLASGRRINFRPTT